MKTNSTPSSAAIADLAYQLWEQAGKPDGRSEEFWHQAENQLRTASKAPISSPAATSPSATAATAPKAPTARRKKRAGSGPQSI